MQSSILYHRDYYNANKDKIQNYNKSYRLANKQYFQDYRKKNKEQLNKYYKKYYDKNLKKCRMNSIIWKQNNIIGYGTYRQKPSPFKKINEQIILTFD